MFFMLVKWESIRVYVTMLRYMLIFIFVIFVQLFHALDPATPSSWGPGLQRRHCDVAATCHEAALSVKTKVAVFSASMKHRVLDFLCLVHEKCPQKLVFHVSIKWMITISKQSPPENKVIDVIWAGFPLPSFGVNIHPNEYDWIYNMYITVSKLFLLPEEDSGLGDEAQCGHDHRHHQA